MQKYDDIDSNIALTVTNIVTFSIIVFENIGENDGANDP